MRALIPGLLGVAGVFLVATGCDDSIINSKATTATVDCQAREPALTWDNFGQGFMEKNCIGCHSVFKEGEKAYLRAGAPPGANFNTYEMMLQWAPEIYDRVFDPRFTAEQQMPPFGGVSADRLAAFNEWMQCQVFLDYGRYQLDQEDEPGDTDE